MVEVLGEVLQNKPLLAAVIALAIAQISKVAQRFYANGKIDLKILLSTGGMPSSHSASMTALATAVGLVEGFSSTAFAIAVMIASVVAYDAFGIRQAAGLHARKLNELIDDYYAGKGIEQKRLKELLGHTPTEVVLGIMLGIIVGLVVGS